MRTHLCLAAVAIGLALVALPTGATTVHVPDDQPTIQAGIDAASYGDTVLVACGTYYEHDIEMRSGIVLRSATGSPDCVTIDAQQQGRVLYCDGVGSLASIVGFTITGGLTLGFGSGMYCGDSSPTLTDCTFSGNQADYDGGGMYCTSSSPTLTDCMFSGNDADNGGGMCCTSSSPTLTDCTFSGNQANDHGGGGAGGDGGGMLCWDNSSPELTDCTFSGNHAVVFGGGMAYSSPDSPSSPTLTRCTFSENETGYGGGGMACFYSSPTLTACTFLGNRAVGYGAYGGDGGGMVCGHSSSSALTNCTFSGNQAVGDGGGMSCWECSPTLTGCTFSGNQADYEGGGMYCSSSSPTLGNCIIAFSEHGEAVYCYGISEPALTCCNVYNNAGGDWVGCIADQHGVYGNISADPLFCDPGVGDFTLCEDSPCLPGNHPAGADTCGLIGAWDAGCPPCGAVLVEEVTWGAIKAMYR